MIDRAPASWRPQTIALAMALAIGGIILAISVAFVWNLHRQASHEAERKVKMAAVALASHVEYHLLNMKQDQRRQQGDAFGFASAYFQQLGIGPSSFSIYDHKLHLISSWPPRHHTAFKPLQKLSLAARLRRENGLITATLGEHFTSRKAVLALAKVAGTNIVIGVEMSPTQYLGAWKRAVVAVFVIVMLSLAGLVGSFMIVRRTMREHRRALDDLEAYKDLKREAEDANRSKSEYLAIVSHEIRTSMSGVLGMAEFMLRSKLYKEQHSGVRVLYDAGQNLVQLINKILDFSKIESGSLELVEAPFEPTDLVDRVADLFSKEALNKGITLDRVKPKIPLWVHGDDLRIRQILANFVGNAIKFTKTGGVSIILETHPVPGTSEKVRLRFEVKDTGIGIPTKLQDRLFQPFQQVDSGIARDFGGTGLGLSICRRLSDLMGAKTWLQSEEGKGSRFFFEIECRRVTAANHEVLDIEPDNLNSGPRASILLVEDNESNLKIAIMYLERDGYRVTGALDGAEAIERFSEGSYDVILMDGAMPRMDGYEATRRIRGIEAEEKRKRVPIIATTANTGPENEARCIAAGMDDFVPKPYRFSDLKVKIARWTS